MEAYLTQKVKKRNKFGLQKTLEMHLDHDNKK